MSRSLFVYHSVRISNPEELKESKNILLTFLQFFSQNENFENGDLSGINTFSSPLPRKWLFITSDVVTRHWFCFQDGGDGGGKICEQPGRKIVFSNFNLMIDFGQIRCLKLFNRLLSFAYLVKMKMVKTTCVKKVQFIKNWTSFAGRQRKSDVWSWSRYVKL